MFAPLADDSVAVMVSVGSCRSSSMDRTVMVRSRTPGSNSRVPEAAS